MAFPIEVDRAHVSAARRYPNAESATSYESHARNKPFFKLGIIKRIQKMVPYYRSTRINTINKYLKDKYNDDNLTEFSYDMLERIFRWEKRLEPHTLSASQRAIDCVSDGETVLDVEGNVGLFSLGLIKRKNVNIIIFEPVPIYRDYCRIVTACFPSISVVGKALSNTNGTARIFVDSDNLGWNTLIKEKITQGMHPIDIETVTLDSFFGDNGDIRDIPMSFIKIDVEGAEYRVLRGSHKTFTELRKKPIILLEIGWGSNHPSWSDEVTEFEWLINNGYQRFNYDYNKTRDVVIIPEDD